MVKVTDLTNTSSDASLLNQVWALTIQILEILVATVFTGRMDNSIDSATNVILCDNPRGF